MAKWISKNLELFVFSNSSSTPKVLELFAWKLLEILKWMALKT